MDPALREALQRSLGPGFRIDRELGGGGMSKVILATDLSLDRQVVVKVLPAELSAAASVDRFRREIQLIAKLQHPHVVPILSSGDADGTLYYVMPFLSGETLRARLARDGPLKVSEAVRILRETLDALAFAHAHGAIHRDIKPENILLSASHAVLADFGVSKALQDAGALTSVGMTVGTPTYMAPEQAAADPTLDHRADLYAVGVVAYEMLTGAPPFSGTPSQVIKSHFADTPVPLKQRRSDVPDSIAELVMRALEKDPTRRPQTAEEMVAVLDAVLTPAGGETTASLPATVAPSASAPAAPTAPQSPAATRKRSRVPAIAAGAVTVAAAVTAWFLLRPDVIASAQSMTITPFSVADGDTALVRLGQNLVTTMSANIDGVGDIRVADPISVLSQAKPSGGLLSNAAAFAIARTLGSRSVVVGNLTRAGAMVRAELALYELAAPGAPLFRVSTSLPVDSIGALTDSLTWGLLRAVWAKGSAPTVNASSIDTRSPAALREFLEGERLFARDDIVGAAAAYQRAVALDTTFWFAHYRYRVARNWTQSPVDTGIARRLGRHLARLPERERTLIVAFDSARTMSDRLERLRAVVARYPDYPPALLSLGDELLHNAAPAGVEVGDAIPHFTRLVQLMPTDATMAEHLVYACMAAGEGECARTAFAHFDTLAHADSATELSTQRVQRRLALAMQGPGPRWVDSVAPLVRAGGIVPDINNVASTGARFAERPDLLRAQERLFEKLASYGPEVVQRMGIGPIVSRLVRGDQATADSLGIFTAAIPDAQTRITNSVISNQFLALWELQGLRVPDRTTADEALALGALPGATPELRREAAWVAGANAIWRGDSTLLRAQMGALASDTSAMGRRMVRSLRALQLGRSGKRGAAAESLLVIEREHGESLGPQFQTMLAADRLLGAEWLAEAGRFAPADSLLRFTRSYTTSTLEIVAVQATFGAAQLLRSRIAEGLGDKARAVEFARIFLATFDMAGAEAEGRRAEARDRVTRMGGTLEGLPGTGKVP